MSQRSLTLIHLSDLHFGPLHRFPSEPYQTLLERLEADLSLLKSEEGITPDLAILTGDLVERGMRDQFEQARQFAVGLARVLGLPQRRVVVIPGNHDINRLKCEGYFADCKGEGKEPVSPYWPKLQPYADFFRSLYGTESDLVFNEEQPFTLFEYPELRMVVAGLNSTIADSHLPDHHYGYVGEEQLRWFAARLRTYRERKWLRIGAVHHHLQSLESGELGLRDVNDLRRILGPDLNLLLNGHVHTDQLDFLTVGLQTVPRFSIGSAGAVAKARPDEVPNQYQIIRIEAERIQFATRRYVPDQKRWVAETRADFEEGRRWLVQVEWKMLAAEATFAAQPSFPLPLGKPDLAGLVERARNQMVKIHRRMTFYQLAGRAEDSDLSGNIDLRSVFIPQTAEQVPPPRRQPQQDALKGVSATSDDVEERPQPLEPPRPVDELLISDVGMPWNLVLGAPGAGKSSLIRWVALRLSLPGETLSPAVADLVPVHVELRRFDERYKAIQKAGGDYDFLRHVDEDHGERGIALRGEALLGLAEAGRIFWLFDGLDEVPNVEARRHYATMIAGIRYKYGGRGLVTSRIIGASSARAPLEEAGFGTWTLQEFSNEQIQLFIDRWHEAAFSHSPETGQSRKERLRTALAASSALYDLCRNPLLLTLIALLNRGGELPKRRHRIYERAIEWMAGQWDANKGIAHVSVLELDEKLDFLRTLALEMMEAGEAGARNQIQEDDLYQAAERFFRETRNESGDRATRNATALIHGIRERDHVLVSLGEQLYGFAHKTFLEYLAADALRLKLDRTLEIGSLVDVYRHHYEDEGWRETLTLIAGILGEERPEKVVELLQGSLAIVPLFEDDKFVSWNQLAIRCLAELKNLQQEPVRSFARDLMELTQRRGERFISVSFEKHGRDRDLGEEVLVALRLVRDAWPDSERWLSWLRTSGELRDDNWKRVRGVRWALSASSRVDRIAHLVDALANEIDDSVIEAALFEARRNGPWMQSEIETLLQFGTGRGEGVLVSIVSVLGQTSFSPSVIDTMRQLMSKGDSEVAAEATGLLLRSKGHDGIQVRSRAVALLKNSTTPLHARFGLFRTLLEYSNDTEKQQLIETRDTLTEEIRRLLPMLLKQFPFKSPSVDSSLRTIVDSMEQNSHAKREAEASSLPVPALRRRAVDELALQVRNLGDTRRWIALSHLVSTAKQDEAAHSMIEEMWGSLQDEDSRLLLAQAVAEIGNPDQRRLARGQLHSLTRQGTTRDLRLRAIYYLLSTAFDPTERHSFLNEVAYSAIDDEARRLAARELYLEPVLRELANTSTDETVRKSAADDLRCIELRRTLLAVGRKRRGIVQLAGTRVGIIEETAQGTRFTYDATYVSANGRPVSPAMPLQREPFESRGLLPYFANLLSEGWQLDLSSHKLKLDKNDRFGLLLATCAETIGAVEIVPEPLP